MIETTSKGRKDVLEAGLESKRRVVKSDLVMGDEGDDN